MHRWKWLLFPWLLSLAWLPMLLTTSHAAPDVTTHTTATDFSSGSGDAGFTITQHQDGELTLTPRALGITPWNELVSTPLPQILYEHAAVAANGHLFIVGGRNGDGLQATVYRAAILVDGVLGAWQIMPPLSQPLHHHALVKAGSGLFVIGGQRSQGPDEAVATVYRATVAANGDLSNWVELAETPLPQPLVGLDAGVVNGYLFVIGGRNSDGQRLSTVYQAPLKADGTLGAWTSAISLPIALSGHAVVGAGNCLFVTGGRSDLDLRREVYSAAISGDGEITAWQELTSARLPQSLADHTATAVGGQLLVVGGSSSPPAQAQDEVYRAAINADCTLEPWGALTEASLPQPIQDHATATAGGYLFVTGGHQYGNSDQYDTVYQAAVISGQNLGGWRELRQASLPQPVYAHAVAPGEDYVFISGGIGGSGVQSSVYRAITPAEGQVGGWIEVSPLPQPLRDHVTVAVGERLLTIGGHNGSTDQSALYQAAVNAGGSLGPWQAHPCPLPAPLSGHAAVLVSDTIYLSGGRQGFEEQASVYRLKGDDDGSQGCWQPVATLPQPLAEHAMAAANDYLFLSGGVSDRGSNAVNTVYSATIKADGTLSHWTELSDSPLPTLLRSHTMAAANGYLYIAGGFDASDLSAQYRVYRAKIKADGGLEPWQGLVTTPLPQALENHAALATDLYLLVLGGYRDTQPRGSVYITSLYQGVQQAAFTHQFDLESDQDIGVLDWQARGDSDAVLSVRFRIAPDASAEYGPWSQAYTNPPIPIYESGRYLQYQLLVENPNGGVKAIDQVSLSYGDIGDYVRVVDDSDSGIPNAEVYLNGQSIGVTGQRGVLPPEALPRDLQPGDQLAALSLAAQTGTAREAHVTLESGGVNWAHRTYLTNLELTPSGQVLPYAVSQSGGQVISLGSGSPLVLSNLLVSIEWDADETYTQQISRAVRFASNYLYDISDGQMAFGYVNIYDNAEHWADADLQISTKNIVRPHAYIGGITSDDKSHVIRVGRFWDGNSGNQGPWDQKEGFRTLAHEFGHYALYLYDEYFAYVFDQDGNLTGEVPASCTGPENRNPATDATNASVMDHQYTTSELSARDVPGLWSPLCEQTAQWQMNGESPWETLTRQYADFLSPPRWQFSTPADWGGPMAGPESLPSAVPGWPLVEIHQRGTSTPPRQLTVYGHRGPFWGALVSLYTSQGGHPVAIDQGFTDRLGRIDIYGARPGDTLRASSFDGALSGSVSVTDALNYTITMTTPASLQALDVPGLNPHLTLRPGSSGDTLYLKLYGLGPGGTLAAIVTQSGGSASQAAALAYSGVESAYVASVTFRATQAQPGTGTIQVLGAGGNSQGISFNTTYALQAVPRDGVTDLHSADGNLHVHLITHTLPVDAYAVLLPLNAAPAAPPEGRQIVGNVYDFRPSGALEEADQPFILRLNYDPEMLKENFIGSKTLRIYRWEPDPNPDDLSDQARWVLMSSSQLEEDNSLSIATKRFGIYALAGYRVAHTSYLPVIMKSD